jgi:hypothetical protein
MSKDKEYDFWCWLSDHGWHRSWSCYTGHTHIGIYKDGWDIDYYGLCEGKFTFCCKKDDSIWPEYVKFDIAFSDDPDRVQKELFEKLEIKNE